MSLKKPKSRPLAQVKPKPSPELAQEEKRGLTRREMSGEPPWAVLAPEMRKLKVETIARYGSDLEHKLKLEYLAERRLIKSKLAFIQKAVDQAIDEAIQQAGLTP